MRSLCCAHLSPTSRNASKNWLPLLRERAGVRGGLGKTRAKLAPSPSGEGWGEGRARQDLRRNPMPRQEGRPREEAAAISHMRAGRRGPRPLTPALSRGRGSQTAPRRFPREQAARPGPLPGEREPGLRCGDSYESRPPWAPAPHPSPLPREREPVLRNRFAT